MTVTGRVSKRFLDECMDQKTPKFERKDRNVRKFSEIIQRRKITCATV